MARGRDGRKKGKRAKGLVEFGTKAETLERLKPRLKTAAILPLVYFTRREWEREADATLRLIEGRLGTAALVVRSSAIGEDSHEESMAGQFDSILNVDGRDNASLRHAIDTVLASQPDSGRNQALVQPMLTDIAVSGVMATRLFTSGAPYYAINYDDVSGRTDTITGGVGASKSVYIYHDAPAAYLTSARVKRWLALARELEDLTGGVPVELEFGQTRSGRLVLFQVRRMSLGVLNQWPALSPESFGHMLKEAREHVAARSRRRPGVVGRRTILAEMSDWNPAEMIGTAPQPLAYSLYRRLVTEHIWRDARAILGYRRVPAEELMVRIGMRPYIDVRNSFNSFLPQGLDDGLSETLVDAWLDRLEEKPELHDKVEFEVAFTALDFSFDQRLDERYPGLVGPRARRRFRDALRGLTLGCLDLGENGSLNAFMQRVGRLEALQEGRTNAQLAKTRGYDALFIARRLLDDCAELGTLPFAGIARHAFIAEALLRSAVTRGALEPMRLEQFKASLKTVATEMLEAMSGARRTTGGRRRFLERFGHLRPGTYDILSLRYDERPELFADLPARNLAERPGRSSAFSLRPKERAALGALLREARLDGVTVEGLLAYARRAITGREYAKFVFTRNLSDALVALVQWGARYGVSREELANIPIETIFDCVVGPPLSGIVSHLRAVAQHNSSMGAIYHAVPLSYLIRHPDEVYVVPVHRSAPNFVTSQRVQGPVRYLDNHQTGLVQIAESIVCIENADPGFDWIFTRNIRGLITKYGGANSHMAIRCTELQLPAAIGCGEQLFARAVGAASIDLNCRDKLVQPIS
jgi:glutamine kinase